MRSSYRVWPGFLNNDHTQSIQVASSAGDAHAGAGPVRPAPACLGCALARELADWGREKAEPVYLPVVKG